jgi:hypothetical protein
MTELDSPELSSQQEIIRKQKERIRETKYVLFSVRVNQVSLEAFPSENLYIFL